MSTPGVHFFKVAANAPLAEVKKAYRRQALVLHPDHNPDPAAARHFRSLTDAYRMLEARALAREPRRPPRTIPLKDRISFLLADIQSLVKRWPDDRLTRVVDGLPGGVWLASVLEVLAKNWPGASETTGVLPTREGISQALLEGKLRLTSLPLPESLDPSTSPLEKAVCGAENRLRALERPSRGGPVSDQRNGL
jgi:hypothetical protein